MPVAWDDHECSQKVLQNTDNCHKLADRVAELVTALINETAGKAITPELESQVSALLQYVFSRIYVSLFI